eukprot:TRINITY_DN49533_c0_g1_i1.p1 TRINITY_DN49533_c0_g1~~TRINITY_DN49533_c0_g1_i1.p1  ORF type:complete len:605 (-),score=93.88 TRINITY_DN49533_c0_g1_i1:16-1830(-)
MLYFAAVCITQTLSSFMGIVPRTVAGAILASSLARDVIWAGAAASSGDGGKGFGFGNSGYDNGDDVKFATRVESPLLDAALWALEGGGTKGVPSVALSCAKKPTFEDCRQPWAAAEVWRYAIANALAATWNDTIVDFGDTLVSPPPMLTASAATLSSAGSRTVAVDIAPIRPLARLAAASLVTFFDKPSEKTFRRAAKKMLRLRSHFLKIRAAGSGEGADLVGASAFPTEILHLRQDAGMGVPFPIAQVILPRDPVLATFQLRGGSSMPLLGLAVRGGSPPSATRLASALRYGIRHLEVAPSVAEAVGRAIKEASVPRSTIFLSVIWELPLTSEGMFDNLLNRLGTKSIDLLLLTRESDARRDLGLFGRLKATGKVRSLGVRGFSIEELLKLPSFFSDEVVYAQCAFTPYRPGPTRDTWAAFGRRSVALSASGLFTDWPHSLRPIDDPHVKAVSSRVRRSPPQVLIRWALQLGLAVVFQTSKSTHLEENLAVFDFFLPHSDMQLLNGLATLAEPSIPPGDGFAHVYGPATQRISGSQHQKDTMAAASPLAGQTNVAAPSDGVGVVLSQERPTLGESDTGVNVVPLERPLPGSKRARVEAPKQEL